MFLFVFNELFIYNKIKIGYIEKFKFFILFEELKNIDLNCFVEIFCKVVEKINDFVMFVNVV